MNRSSPTDSAQQLHAAYTHASAATQSPAALDARILAAAEQHARAAAPIKSRWSLVSLRARFALPALAACASLALLFVVVAQRPAQPELPLLAPASLPDAPAVTTPPQADTIRLPSAPAAPQTDAECVVAPGVQSDAAARQREVTRLESAGCAAAAARLRDAP